MQSEALDHAHDQPAAADVAQRLFGMALGTLELAAVYIGDRLGLYRALHDDGAMTSTDLAERTGTDERYVREWLEQQAVAGLLQMDTRGTTAAQRRYVLAAGAAEALLDADSLRYMGAAARLVFGCVAPMPQVLAAFRTGAGVPYEAYGSDTREGIAEINRPMFLNLVGTRWLPAVADVHARLRSDPPARVADVGCGAGWSSIAIARAYPKARVDGFDLDAPSIELARGNAFDLGLAGRLHFETRDAADPALAGSYDLVTAFETVHDMAKPIDALRAMRRLVTPRGSVIVADERVADTFAAPGDEIERWNYGFSVIHCLPVGRCQEGSAETGAVMRTPTLRTYALEAGFRALEVLPIEHELWRFYRLVA